MDRLQWLYPIYAVQGCCHRHLLRYPFHMEKNLLPIYQQFLTGCAASIGHSLTGYLSTSLYGTVIHSVQVQLGSLLVPRKQMITIQLGMQIALQATIQTSHTIQPPLVREDAIVARQPSNSIVNNPFSFNETAFLFLY